MEKGEEPGQVAKEGMILDFHRTMGIPGIFTKEVITPVRRKKPDLPLDPLNPWALFPCPGVEYDRQTTMAFYVPHPHCHSD